MRTYLRALLRWHASLDRWPRPPRAPDATPFVTLYAGGRIRGCFGVAEGTPGERIARAFLRAAADERFGGVAAVERGALVASVSYARGALTVSGEEAFEALEPGTHGAVLVPDGASPTFLLPQVARDGGLDARAFLSVLSQKAGLGADGWRDATMVLFEAETVGSRDVVEPLRARDRADAAAAWLARRIARDGSVSFAVDPRTGARTDRGPMFHGRACTLVQALAAHPAASSRAATARARRFLTREIAEGLSGRPPRSWPEDPAQLGGTLALAVLGGIDVRADLVALAQHSDCAAGSPWHAAQIALALGADTPARVWRTAVTALDTQPFAPWTLLAARGRSDSAQVVARCEAALSAALREGGPHAGGAMVTPIPETALTAIAVEALAPLGRASSRARAAVTRGRGFLRRWQLVPGRIPAALDSGPGPRRLPRFARELVPALRHHRPRAVCARSVTRLSSWRGRTSRVASGRRAGTTPT